MPGPIVIEECRSCGATIYPAQGYCAVCLSGDVEHMGVSGEGTVLSYCLQHFSFEEEFQKIAPYYVASVQLPSGINVYAVFDGTTPHVGQKVSLSEQLSSDGTPYLTTSEKGT